MKHIRLDQEDDRIKSFIRSLPLDAEGSVLELGGVPILRVLPPSEPQYDEDRLEEAILRRRDESLAESAEWSDVDRETSDGTARRRPDEP